MIDLFGTKYVEDISSDSCFKIVSDGRFITNLKWLEKNVWWPNRCTIPIFSWEKLSKTKIKSVRRVDVTAKIRNKNLQNTCLHFYCSFVWFWRRSWTVCGILTGVLFSFCYLVFLVESHEAEEEATACCSGVMTLEEKSLHDFTAHRISCYLLNWVLIEIYQSYFECLNS